MKQTQYPHNKRLIALRVVQIGQPDDFRPETLIALCLPCLRVYEQRTVARQIGDDDQTDGLLTQSERKRKPMQENRIDTCPV
jgi:hypothetical protein